jgi:hypothetical protein
MVNQVVVWKWTTNNWSLRAACHCLGIYKTNLALLSSKLIVSPGRALVEGAIARFGMGGGSIELPPWLTDSLAAKTGAAVIRRAQNQAGV